MDQFILGLNTYYELLRLPPYQAPIVGEMREEYSFEAFIDLIKRLSKQDLLYNSSFHQLKIERANLQFDQSVLDNLVVSYLTQSSNDPLHLIRGLKIITRRVNIEVEKKKLQVLEKEVDREEDKKRVLEEELGAARERIRLEGINLIALQAKVEVKKKALLSTQDQLLKLESALINDRSLIAGEKILIARIQKALAEALLIQARSEHILGKILVQKEPVHALYNQLHELEKEEALIRDELGEWKDGADLYLEIALSNGNPEAVPLAQRASLLAQQVEREHRTNGLLIDQSDDLMHVRYMTFGDRMVKYWESFVLLWKRYSQWSHKSLFKIGETPITFFGILKVIFIILIAYFFAKFFQFWVKRIGKKQHRIQQAGVYTLGRISYYIILIIGIIIAIPIVIEKFILQKKNAPILLPSKQPLFEDRGDGEGSEGGSIFRM